MAGDVTADGTPLDPQPSRFVPHPPVGTKTQGINGLFNLSTPTFGWSFELQYGSDQLADPDSLAAVISAFPVGQPVELGWTDWDGSTPSKMVALAEEIVAPFRWGTNAERYSFFVYEVAAVTS